MFLFVAAVAHLALPHYKVTTLPLPNDYTAISTGMNDKGDIVGFLPPRPDDLASTAFVWKSGHLIQLQSPQSGENAPATLLTGINNDGLAIGFYQWQSPNDEGSTPQAEGFTWKEDAGVHAISVQSNSFIPGAIDNKGDIGGMAYYSDAYQLGIYRNGAFQSLMTTPDGSNMSFAVPGLNDSDTLVANPHETQDVAVKLAPGQSPKILPPNGQGEEVVSGINESGWMIGHAVVPNHSGSRRSDWRGLMWSPDDAVTDLGAHVLPTHINDSNEIVAEQYVGDFRNPTNTDAMVGLPGTTPFLHNLNDLVPAGTPHLDQANLINNKGEILCRSHVDGKSVWMLLTPQ